MTVNPIDLHRTRPRRYQRGNSDKLLDDSLGGLVLQSLHYFREPSFVEIVVVCKQMSMELTQLPVLVVSFPSAMPGSGESLLSGLYSREYVLLEMRSTEVW